MQPSRAGRPTACSGTVDLTYLATDSTERASKRAKTCCHYQRCRYVVSSNDLTDYVDFDL